MYFIYNGVTPDSRLIARIAGPPDFDLPVLYRDFVDLYDHDECDEWLEFFDRLGARAHTAPPDALLAAALVVIHAWRARQPWYDSGGNLDVSFLTWLVLQHACVIVPVLDDTLTRASIQRRAVVLGYALRVMVARD